MRFLKKFAKWTIGAILLVSCIAAILLGTFFLKSNDEVSQKKVFAYVNGHAEALAAFPYREMPRDDDQKRQFIRDQLGEDTIVKGVHCCDSNTLAFYCGGRGNVSGSVYSGFYYSADDAPNALEFEKETTFTEIGEGKFEWASADGQKQFRTERIQPNWFYYRMIWN